MRVGASRTTFCQLACRRLAADRARIRWLQLTAVRGSLALSLLHALVMAPVSTPTLAKPTLQDHSRCVSAPTCTAPLPLPLPSLYRRVPEVQVHELV
jgi:hypothetical protein